MVVLRRPIAESLPISSALKKARRNAARSLAVGEDTAQLWYKARAVSGVADFGAREERRCVVSAFIRLRSSAAASSLPSAQALKNRPDSGSRNPRPSGVLAAGPY